MAGGIALFGDVALRQLREPDYAHDMAYIALAFDLRTGEAKLCACLRRRASGDHGGIVNVRIAPVLRRAQTEFRTH
jgi:hypothetical protein